ncbi:MAG TPA: helix-turn-helix domain-containing protein [Oscillospiraceae bacterium]|nr:helix-turn-helix domain-containing protein [Oscillospiraceae bacterium]
MDVKDIIRNARLAKGLTMKEVADMVGVSEPTISRWESGEIENMRQKGIVALARALDLTPGEIMGWSEEKTQVEELEEDFPEGVAFIRRANKELTPAGKKRMIELMKLFMEEVDAKENEQRGNK